jgi:hypothetical protein
MDNQKAKNLAIALMSLPRKNRVIILGTILRRYGNEGLALVKDWYERLTMREESTTVLEVIG